MAQHDQRVGVAMTAGKIWCPMKQFNSFSEQIDVQDVQTSEVKTGPSEVWIEDLDKSRYTLHLCC